VNAVDIFERIFLSVDINNFQKLHSVFNSCYDYPFCTLFFSSFLIFAEKNNIPAEKLLEVIGIKKNHRILFFTKL
jgi:hypothetical protein